MFVKENSNRGKKLSAVFITLIESMKKINCFLAYCFTFYQGCTSIPFICFSSLADQIKYSETLKYSEQYFRDQESGTKVNICNFSAFEAVTNFSFTAAYSLSSSSALFLVSLSYIGDGSSISISKTYAAEMFSFYTFKTFLNVPFAFEGQLYWATPWILTGETPMLSEVELSFFFGDSYNKKLSSDINSSCEHSVLINSVMFSF